MMLGNPTPGRKQPSQIIFGQAAKTGQESVPNDKQTEDDEVQPTQTRFPPGVCRYCPAFLSNSGIHDYNVALTSPSILSP
jgi:hypothetical protein